MGECMGDDGVAMVFRQRGQGSDSRAPSMTPIVRSSRRQNRQHKHLGSSGACDQPRNNTTARQLTDGHQARIMTNGTHEEKGLKV